MFEKLYIFEYKTFQLLSLKLQELRSCKRFQFVLFFSHMLLILFDAISLILSERMVPI